MHEKFIPSLWSASFNNFHHHFWIVTIEFKVLKLIYWSPFSTELPRSSIGPTFSQEAKHLKDCKTRHIVDSQGWLSQCRTRPSHPPFHSWPSFYFSYIFFPIMLRHNLLMSSLYFGACYAPEPVLQGARHTRIASFEPMCQHVIRTAFLLEAVGEETFPCPFQLQAPTHTLGLCPFFSIFTANTIASSSLSLTLPTPSLTYVDSCDYTGPPVEPRIIFPAQDP